MQIRQFRYHRDNLGYLVYGQKEAGAIDGGAVSEMLAFLEANHLTLTWVTNTHAHPDHTAGTAELADRGGAERIPVSAALERGRLPIEGESIRVIPTPGHTNDSVTFQYGDWLVTGDTLFNGTVGNCFSGNLAAFYESIRTLMAFPPETRVYAGHDYVRDSMTFARMLEPGNTCIDAYLSAYDPAHVVSTVDDEKNANPYVRYNEASMIAVMKAKGLAVGTELERWNSLMSLG